MIDFSCPECGKLLKTADEKAGRKARCPNCKTAFTVPGAVDLFDTDFEDEPKFEAAPMERTARRVVRKASADCPMCGGTILVTARRCRHPAGGSGNSTGTECCS